MVEQKYIFWIMEHGQLSLSDYVGWLTHPMENGYCCLNAKI